MDELFYIDENTDLSAEKADNSQDNVDSEKVAGDSSDTTDDSEKAVSIHRAFLYSIAMPGWGEGYSGNKKRSTITYSLLTLAILIFFWANYEIFVAFGVYSRSFREGSPLGIGDVFLFPGIIFLLGCGSLYIIWMWAMLSSVEVGVEARKSKKHSRQQSPFWALFMTYFCPGAGHMYMGQKSRGYILCGISIIATFSILFSIGGFVAAASDMFLDGQAAIGSVSSTIGPAPASTSWLQEPSISAASISDFSVVRAKLNALATYLTLGFGAILTMIIQVYVLSEIAHSFSRKFLYDYEQSESKLSSASIAAFAGYLCPGCGQLLGGRTGVGWSLVYSIIGIKVLVYFMIAIEVLARENVGSFLSLTALIGWIAIIEAPARLILAGRKSN